MVALLIKNKYYLSLLLINITEHSYLILHLHIYLKSNNVFF